MKVFLSGIGGIGMSALARYYVSLGHQVSGSDQSKSELTGQLVAEGIGVTHEQVADNIDQSYDLFVYSEAIATEHPERQRAVELNIDSQSYFAALGKVSQQMPTIAIAGTHGKSTTTTMLGLMAEQVSDPLVIVGTKVFEWGGKNIRLPAKKNAEYQQRNSEEVNNHVLSSPWEEKREEGCLPNTALPPAPSQREGEAPHPALFIVEACEYRGSFLHLKPNVIVITNCEPDHLDYYKTAENYYQTFVDFVAQLPADGTLVADFTDPTIHKLFGGTDCHQVNVADFADHVPELKVIGEHNRANAATALAALSVVAEKNIAAETALQNFRGSWRRMEHKGELGNQLLYDDYAHHPTEITVTIAALREQYPDRPLWLVFQPHQFSRTRAFFDEFATSLVAADQVLIPNIYGVRDSDADQAAVSAAGLVAAINDASGAATDTQDFQKTADYIHKNAPANALIVTMGAGDVWQVGDLLMNNF